MASSIDEATLPLRVDVDALLKLKVPKQYHLIPRVLISWLKRVVHQDELNELLELYGHLQGEEFATAIIMHLDITLEVEGLEQVDPLNVKVIFAGNHPLGALDGIAMISLLGKLYPNKFKFIVNDMLMVVRPLSGIFLPVNKHGAQSRHSVCHIQECMTGDYAIATFPAGLCSRNTHGNIIEDLPWKKTFIVQARTYDRQIIPFYFTGQNSKLFYRVARLRKALGIRFNIEMILLPREIFNSRGKRFKVVFGNPESVEMLADDVSSTENPDTAMAEKIRRICYSLKD